MNPGESITAPANLPPTVAEERAQRQAHVAILRAWFLAHPWIEITPTELKALVGDNYQQRISNLRRDCLRLVNLKSWVTHADGSKTRLAGSYRYEPFEPIGRNPTTPAAGACMPRVQGEMFR